MGFTTVNAVALLFPSFTRGVPNQKPSDTLIQQFIDDTADMIVGILERRFNEQITAIGSLAQYLVSLGLPDITWYPSLPVALNDIVVDANDPQSAQQVITAGTTSSNPNVTFNAVYGGVTTDGTALWKNIGQSRQLRVLERGNRYGASVQLGPVLASISGVDSARKIAENYQKEDWKPFLRMLNAQDEKGEPADYGVFDFLFDPLANVQTPRPILQGIAGGDQLPGVAPDLEGTSSVFGKFGVDGTRRSPGWTGWRNFNP